LQPLDTQPALIDRAYERLVAAIASGTLAAGRRIRQEELAAMLGVSRQPISHALQLLKRQGLVEEAGKRGLIVCGIDAARIRELYQVRTALDALAARLAAARIAEGTAGRRNRPSPPVWRSARKTRWRPLSMPMSRFTPRSTGSRAIARSTKQWRRNGRI